MSHPTISQRKTSMGHQHLTRSQRDINKSISANKISKEKRHQWINESSQKILGETSMSHPHLTKSWSSMTSMSHLTQYQMETLMSHQHLIRSKRKISMSHHHLTISQEEASLSYHHLTRSQRNTNESSPFHKIPKRDISKSSSSHEISDGGYWSKCRWLSSMIEIQIRSWSSPHIVYMILYHFFY